MHYGAKPGSLLTSRLGPSLRESTTLIKKTLNIPPNVSWTSRWQYGLALSSIIAILDYSVVSLTKFSISIFLARHALPAEFGTFVLAFSLLTFYNSLQIGLVGEPLTVLGAPLQGRRLAQHVGMAVLTVGGLSIVLGILTAIMTLLLTTEYKGSIFSTFLTLGWVTLPVQLQDLFRRALFAKRHSGQVLGNDLLLTATQVGGLIWIQHQGRLTACNALFIVGVSSLVAAVMGGVQVYWMVATPLPYFFPDSRDSLRALWSYGRWSLGSQIAFNASTQGYLYAAGAMLGPIAAGVLKACQNLVAPIQLLLLGMDSLLMAVGSQRYSEEGMRALKPFLWSVGLLVIFLTLPYVTGVSFLANALLDWLYKGQYNGYDAVVALYALYYLAFAGSRPFVLGLRSIRQPAWIFRGYLIATIFAALSFFPLIQLYDVKGAAIGSAVTGVAFLIVVAIAFSTIGHRPLSRVEP